MHDGARDAPAIATSGPWTRHTRRVAYENPWIVVWHDELTRPDGSPGIYGVVHFRNAASGVVVLDDSDQLLLVGQHRYTLDAYSWEIPEGGVAPNEDPLDGIQRELREETGMNAREWRQIGTYALSNSITDELGLLWLATGLSQGAATPDPTEDLAVRWVPFDEALAMTLDGRITDAVSIMGIQRVALTRLEAVIEHRAHGG
jgi:8-oxo-dGTP pyrophosphatase MutT (NUDIX family)